ncbi:hypothetical protein [Sphaerisporangium perillae]|uniref:hypothetical protein n=1 Tax=Sphaerisporangium perillae TaxID=2935860 RepID=UPI00200F7B1E|nr:hypothetical protein [Sphaerisporangium perillae]
MLVEPRRLLSAEYDVKIMFERMLYDEFGPGGFLAGDVLGNTPEQRRKALLLGFALVRHINGQAGYCNVGMSTIAQKLGYGTNDHKLSASLRALLHAGVFTQAGNHRRAPKVHMSLPERLRDAYEDLAANTDPKGRVITVIDTGKRAPAAPQPPVMPADPSPLEEDDDPWAPAR